MGIVPTDSGKLSDVLKTKLLKAMCMMNWYIYQYWYIWDKLFKFQPNICSACHDVLIFSMKVSDIAILSINGSHYYFKIKGITEAKDLLKKTNLIRTSRTFPCCKSRIF